jgi:hypothetical protein
MRFSCHYRNGSADRPYHYPIMLVARKAPRLHDSSPTGITMRLLLLVLIVTIIGCAEKRADHGPLVSRVPISVPDKAIPPPMPPKVDSVALLHVEPEQTNNSFTIHYGARGSQAEADEGKLYSFVGRTAPGATSWVMELVRDANFIDPWTKEKTINGKKVYARFDDARSTLTVTIDPK